MGIINERRLMLMELKELIGETTEYDKKEAVEKRNLKVG